MIGMLFDSPVPLLLAPLLRVPLMFCWCFVDVLSMFCRCCRLCCVFLFVVGAVVFCCLLLLWSCFFFFFTSGCLPSYIHPRARKKMRAFRIDSAPSHVVVRLGSFFHQRLERRMRFSEATKRSGF